MNEIQCGCCYAINGGCNCVYKGIAFSGCNFYLTCPQHCRIDVFDCCLKKVNSIQVCHAYTSILYDCLCNCFWALTEEEPNKIYKLNLNMQEVGCISVKFTDKIYKLNFNVQEVGCISIKFTDCSPVILTGISNYDCKNLLISGSFGLATVSKQDDGCITIIERANCDVQYSSVLNTPCGMVIARNIGTCNSVVWCEPCKESVTCYLPDCYHIEDMACCSEAHCCKVIILMTKGCRHSFIMICNLCHVQEGPCICKPICSCSQCTDCQNCSQPNCMCANGASSIIESIALSEAALAHILNAEGEKLQKVICQAESTCEIINVNETVHKTIISITHLEQVLYAKLLTAQELCKCTESDCNDCFCKELSHIQNPYDICANGAFRNDFTGLT